MADLRTLLLWAVVTECWILLILGSCPAGKFGDSCSYSCHCGHSCNQTTGVCGGGCDRGWVGGHGGTCQKENIAYKKNATSSGIYRPAWTADKAVDGNRDQEVNHNSCFHSYSPPSVWTVDLEQQYRIHDVRIYHRNEYTWRIRTVVLSLSNSSSSTPGVPCYTFPSNTSRYISVYDVICDGRGRYFTIIHTTAYLNLCEVEIYVCSQGSFGTDCNHFCHCSDGPCDGVSGICAGDCRPGWRGQKCSIECDQDHYGVNCNEMCGNRNCATDTSSCDRHTGSCDTGCRPGWTAVDCTQECFRGTYGQNCSKQCTDRNCAENSSCDHVTGSCVSGCKAGWMGTDCVETCEPDLYGPACTKTCARRHCMGNSSCNSTGDCDTGCETGWTGTDCTACDSQHYGPNCTKNSTSRHCAGDSSCNSKGNCDSGCKAGWMESDCTECDQDHYGVSCNETCGNRNCAANTSSCDRHTGSCDTGCLPGWTAVDCTQECSPRNYGQNCGKQCTDRNCAGNSSCDHVTGSCVPGCKAGWMGRDCVEACDAERYGANCDKACTSRHCRGSSSCNSTGDCDSGCETGWTLSDCTGENEEARLPQGAGYNAAHMAVAVAVSFVVGAVVSAVVASVVWWRRKRRPPKTSESHPDSAFNGRTNQSQISDRGGPESRTYDSLNAGSYDTKMTGETYCTIASVNTDSEANAATSRDVSESVGAQMYENLHHTSREMNGEYSEIGKPNRLHEGHT